jgi:hypothetical protein
MHSVYNVQNVAMSIFRSLPSFLRKGRLMMSRVYARVELIDGL